LKFEGFAARPYRPNGRFYQSEIQVHGLRSPEKKETVNKSYNQTGTFWYPGNLYFYRAFCKPRRFVVLNASLGKAWGVLLHAKKQIAL